jgi:hypothetical protein
MTREFKEKWDTKLVELLNAYTMLYALEPHCIFMRMRQKWRIYHNMLI